MVASLNCSIPPLTMLMLWYVYVPALTVQVPFTVKSVAALPGPSAELPLFGHVIAGSSTGVDTRFGEMSPAEATHSGIVARFDDSQEPLAAPLNTKASERTVVIETNRATACWRVLRQRDKTHVMQRFLQATHTLIMGLTWHAREKGGQRI